jgi:hypothetical protein
MKKFEINYLDEYRGYEHCMPVEADECDINRMVNPDVIVHVGEKTINIQFDYPLSTEVQLPFNHPRGESNWTRRDIYDAIRKGYNEIYDQEEFAIDSDKPAPYGIWGHCIYDLVIEEVAMNKKGILELSIGS